MGKRRVHEIAKELGIESKDLIKKLHDIGVDVKSHSSTVDEDDLKRALAGPAPKKPDVKRAPGMMVRKKADIPTPKQEEMDAQQADLQAQLSEESEHDGGEPLQQVVHHEPVRTPLPPVVHAEPEHGHDIEHRHAAEQREEISAEQTSAPMAEQPRHEDVHHAPVDSRPESQHPAAQMGTQATPPQAQPPVQQSTASSPPAAPNAQKPEGTAPTTGARVVRMIDRATLVNRIPQRRPAPGGFRPGGAPGGPRPGGPGGFRPGGPSGPGGFRPGGPRPGPGMLEPQMPTNNRFGPVKELRVVSDVFGKGKEMVDVTGGKNAKKGGAKTTADGKRERLDKRSLMQMHERNFAGNRLRRRRGSKRKTESTTAATMKESKRVVRMDNDTITVSDLAAQLSVKATDIIRKLMELGTMATINQGLDYDTASVIAQAYNFRINDESFDEDEFIEADDEQGEENLQPRPPVVTVMGHVDHGKTSLLDAIREADVASGEAGGITQHIGAYTVDTEKGSITFLDTPGHEAFTSMRARGAEVTDLVILVVAADDGPMPQTVEAIRHAQAAKVPIIVAINKMDKPGAKPDQIMQALTEYQLVPEEWGGDTIYVRTSATKREGIDTLLESVLLQAEVLELAANPDKYGRGTVIEARLDKGFGPRATVIVQEGTVAVGDWVVVGTTYGRIRALHDSRGNDIEAAGPSMPVEIVGLDNVPAAGDQLNAVEDQDAAKAVAEHRAEQAKQKDLAKRQPKVSLEDLYAKLKGGQGGQAKDFKIIVKADVQGSVEALSQAFRKLSTSEVQLSIVHAAVGAVTEGDVMLASTSGAVVICFNVRADAKAKSLAEQEGVELKSYNIIYNALDDVKKAMGGLLAPTTQEKVLGRAEVRQVFNTPKLGVVAGCAVTEGKITRSSRVRLVRESKQQFDGKLAGLKRFKDDVREVAQGFECGMVLDGFTDVKVGDIIEAYEVLEIARTLDSPPPPTRPAGGPGRTTGANASPAH